MDLHKKRIIEERGALVSKMEDLERFILGNRKSLSPEDIESLSNQYYVMTKNKWELDRQLARFT